MSKDVSQEKTYLHIPASSVWKVVVILFAAYVLYIIRDLIVVLLTSVVIASSVEPATKALARYKFPRLLGVLTVYVGAFVIFFGVIYFLGRPFFADLAGVFSLVPSNVGWLSPLAQSASSTASTISTISGTIFHNVPLADIIKGVENNASGNFFQIASSLFGGAFSFILIVVISFYLAVQDRGVESFLKVVAPANIENYVIDLWKRSERKIGRWAQGQILLGLIIGPLVFLGLTILGIKYALVLAIVASLFELIPFFGPVLSAVPAVLLGFQSNLTLGLMVIGLYIIIQQFENNLIYPLVVKKIIGVPPLVVILSLLVGWKLVGFLGLILAVPAAVVIMELLGDYERRKLKQMKDMGSAAG